MRRDRERISERGEREEESEREREREGRERAEKGNASSLGNPGKFTNNFLTARVGGFREAAHKIMSKFNSLKIQFLC